MTMTTAQYIALRKSGKKRNDILKEHFGNDSIKFRNYLSMIGLLNLEVELIAMRDFKPQTSEPKETLPFEPTKKEVEKEMIEQQAPGRKQKFPHVTKEFIESAFAAGKSAGQIEKEEGMLQGTIYVRINKWGIVNPKSKKKADSQEKAETVAERAEGVEERIDCDYEAVDDAVIEKSEDIEANSDACKAEESYKPQLETEPTQFIYFQIPIIKGYEAIDRGFADLFGAIQLAATRNVDLVRTAEELFLVMQRYTHLLHEQMETLVVEGNPVEHVQKFIQKHNTIHINKQIVT